MDSQPIFWGRKSDDVEEYLEWCEVYAARRPPELLPPRNEDIRRRQEIGYLRFKTYRCAKGVDY